MKPEELEFILIKIGYFNNRTKLYKNLKEISLFERFKLKDKIASCISFNNNPSNFLNIHDLCWREHNYFDEELTSKGEKLPELFKSPKGISIAKELFETSIGLDRAKRIVSNSVKQIIEKYTLSNHMTNSEINPLLTSLTEPFYIQYARDLHTLDDISLAKKYFLGSIKLAITEKAIAKNNLPKDYPFEEDWKDLDRRILLHKKTLLSQKYGKEVFAIDQLLERDHLQEYLYRSSLVGMGDYYLHLLVSNFTGISPKEFDKKLLKLDKIKESNKNSFKYKIPKFYQTDFRCAVSSFLNGLYSLKNITPTRKLEKELTDSILALPEETTATLPTLLGKISSSKYGLETKLIFEERSLLTNNELAVEKGYFERYMKRLKSTLKDAKKENVKVEITKLDSNKIRSDLEKGPIILATWIENITHYNLIHGYNDNRKTFLIFDPFFGEKEIKYENIEEYSKTPFGRWAISISNDMKDLKDLSKDFKNRYNELVKGRDYLIY